MPEAMLVRACQAILEVGLALLVQSAALLLLGLFAARAVRRHGPLMESTIHRATLAAVVLSAALSIAGLGRSTGGWRVSLPPAPVASAAVAAPADAVPLAGPTVSPNRAPVAVRLPASGGRGTGAGKRFFADLGPATASEPVRAGPARPDMRGRWYLAAVGIWAAGALLGLGWLLFCHFWVLRLRRAGAPATGEPAVLLARLCAELGTAPPRLLVSPRVSSPFLAGFRHPAILLPAGDAERLDATALRSILAHEVAHLARRDCWWNLLARVACALAWMQPLLWLLCRRLEQASEEACDLEAVRHEVSPRAYARCLLDLAERLSPARDERVVGATVVPFRSALGRRVERLLDGAPRSGQTPSRRAWLLVGAAASAAILAGPFLLPAGAALEESVLPLFRGDARLAAKADLAWQDRPLGEALPELGKQLKVRLTASPATADDRATLFLQDRPAAEALSLLARHFNFQWSRDRDGYQLGQSTAAARREAVLRAEDLIAQLRPAHERLLRMAQLLGPDGSLPRERLEARQQAVNARLGMTDLPAEERAALGEESQVIGDLLRRGAGAAAALIYRSLNPQQLKQLRADVPLKFSTADGTLPARAAELAHRSARESPRGPGGPGEQESRRSVIQRREGGRDPQAGTPPRGRANGPSPDEPPKQVEVTVRLSDSSRGLKPGPAGRAQRARTIDFWITLVYGTEEDQRQDSTIWAPQLSGTADPMPEPTVTDDPELNREVELRLPEAAPPVTPPPPRSALQMVAGGAWPAGLVTVGRVAEQIRQATGLDVAADGFIRGRIDPGRLAGRQPLVRILDTLSQELDYTWRKEGRTILLRNRVYFRDRPMEVPARLLRPWRARVEKQGMAVLDDLAALAATLNDARCRGMQDHWGWYLEGAGPAAEQGHSGLYWNRQHFRLWAALAAVQRREALNGGVVAVERMSPAQRQTFVAALAAARDASFSPVGLRRPPTAAELAAGGFSLRAVEERQQAYTGTSEDGRRRMMVVRSVGGEPDEPEMAGEFQLEPLGGPVTVSAYTFTYHLAGDRRPAQTVTLNVPRTR